MKIQTLIVKNLGLFQVISKYINGSVPVVWLGIILQFSSTTTGLE